MVAVIDPKGPTIGEFAKAHPDRPRGPDGFEKDYWTLKKWAPQIIKEWIAEFAPFQQWLGVELANCLQFYKVNYEAHGVAAFNVQRAGGKLYGILDSKGKPIAAILTEKDGSIRETNGPGNRPPPEKDQEYVDRFITKHLKQDVKDTAFHPPEGFPRVVGFIIDHILDYWPQDNIRGRRRFLRKVQGYARQQGADFEKIWDTLAVYLLQDSKYSLYVCNQRIKYSQKTDTDRLIKDVVRLYLRARQSMPDFERAKSRAAMLQSDINDTYKGIKKKGAYTPNNRTFRNASNIVETISKIVDTKLRPDSIFLALDGIAFAPALVFIDPPSDKASEAEKFRRKDKQFALMDDVGVDYVEKFLELMRDAARAAGGAAPAGNPTGARGLIKDCQTTWESYCEKPGKARLKKVFSTLKKMETSKATTVRSERSRCLRSARAEDRKHSYGLS